jgi:hypothetical protein
MMIHNLKSLSEYFNAVWHGAKNFEIRKNDRNFREGEFVILQEWQKTPINWQCDPLAFTKPDPEWDYTGGIIIARITYVTDYEQKEGYVVFGMEVLDKKFLLGDKPCETFTTTLGR